MVRNQFSDLRERIYLDRPRWDWADKKVWVEKDKNINQKIGKGRA